MRTKSEAEASGLPPWWWHVVCGLDSSSSVISDRIWTELKIQSVP